MVFTVVFIGGGISKFLERESRSSSVSRRQHTRGCSVVVTDCCWPQNDLFTYCQTYSLQVSCYHSTTAGGVVSLFVLSFILSVSRITDDRGNGHRQNLTGMGKGWPSRGDPQGVTLKGWPSRGDPQEVFNFCCWCWSACRCRTSFSLSSTLADTIF